MNREVFGYIQDYPIKVNMYGCRGNIYTLRSAGWNIAIQCEYSYQNIGYELRICGEHRTSQAKLLSEICHINPSEIEYGNGFEMFNTIEIGIGLVAGQIHIQGEFDYSRFRAFTGTHPIYQEIKQQDFDPRKIPFFSDAIAENEIILPEKSIYESLQEILKKQEPHMAELRAKRLELKRKAAKGEKIEENLLYLPNATKKIEIITVGA